MKRLYTLLFLSLFICSLGTAQDFSDDFESYSVGDYIGTESDTWTTWSGATGNAEDAVANADQSLSGSNSIHFSSSAAGGGPQDVVLPFGQKYTSGLFSFSMAVYVKEGTGAYWNFQGETTIGVTWSHNCYLLETGELQFSNLANGLGLGTTYEFDTWNVIDYEVNLDTDIWKISLNGECLGSFVNEGADVASLDIFPVDGNDFYIDDVSFSHTEDVPVRQYDAALGFKDLGAGGFTGSSLPISATITNAGEELILSAEVELRGPSGVKTFTIENIDIPNGVSTDFTLPEEYSLSDGYQEITLEVLSINDGKLDEEPCNSNAAGTLLGATAAEGKGVLVEEGTGTWCGWCPRGSVFLEALIDKYGGDRFVGVAVHNGANDPMVVSGYDGQHGFDGYPQAIVDREVLTGFPIINALELPFLENISKAPAATFELAATYDVATRVLNLNSVVTANEAMGTDYAVSMILTEDYVRGTGTGWGQSNFYAGGGNGPMGGYESLPGTVTSLPFDHVARMIPLGYTGAALNAEMGAGDSESYDYTLTLEEAWSVVEMSIVMLLLNPDGSVNNAYQVAMTELFITNTAEANPISDDITIYPNPTSGDITVELTTDDSRVVDVRVVDVLGKTVLTDRFTSAGSSQHTLKVDGLAAGSYYTVLTSGTQTSVLQFTKD